MYLVSMGLLINQIIAMEPEEKKSKQSWWQWFSGSSSEPLREFHEAALKKNVLSYGEKERLTRELTDLILSIGLTTEVTPFMINRMRALLEQGASIKTTSGTSFLVLANELAKTNASVNQIIKLFLEYGSDVHERYKFERKGTPLIYYLAYSQRPDIAVVQSFLEHGSDINAKDLIGMTPLMYAEQRGVFEIGALLRAWKLKGALAIEPSSIQKTVFDLGMNRKYTDIAPIVQRISNLEDFKKLIVLQINLALFIANRISFDLDSLESNAFKYPEHEALTSGECNRFKAQWRHLFFGGKEKLKQVNSFILLDQSLILIHEFLEDIGYVSPDYPKEAMQFIENDPLWAQNFKKEIAENFRFLFEHLFVVSTI